MFDHTLSKPIATAMSNLHERAHYFPLGLSASHRGADGRTDNLSAIVRWLGHSRIDVLKIDCEGCLPPPARHISPCRTPGLPMASTGLL